MTKLTHLIPLLLPLTILILNSPKTTAQNCRPTGYFRGTDPPPGQCNPQNSLCCKAGQVYTTLQCSPDVTNQTSAILTLNNYEKGGHKCNGKYYNSDDKTPVVTLSTGWYDEGKRCNKEIVIVIRGNNGKSVRAKVVGECDSTMGCDKEHGYQPPCGYNIVGGSQGVWIGLSVPKSQWGDQREITWSDA